MGSRARKTVIMADKPPGDLSLRHGIAALFYLQHWEAANERRHEPYGPGLFYHQVLPVFHGLKNISRETVLRHVQAETCVACTAHVNIGRSELDPIIPKSHGGPDSLENSMGLCRRCNASKGQKDLLEWWSDKGFGVAALPRNILCLYARIIWQHSPEEKLSVLASDALVAFLSARAALLPSDAHRIALYGGAYLVCCYRFWALAHLESMEAPLL